MTYSQPRHVTISNGIPTEAHDHIKAAVALAAMLTDTDLSETEVHVKQKARPAHGVHGSASAFSGYAYYWYRDPARGDKRPGGLPPTDSTCRVQPGVRYLVTVSLTKYFMHATYPFEWRYQRYKTAQGITLNTWGEELLHLLVHEFTHVKQYVTLSPHSEIECEFLAHQAVFKYREYAAKAAREFHRKGGKPIGAHTM